MDNGSSVTHAVIDTGILGVYPCASILIPDVSQRSVDEFD